MSACFGLILLLLYLTFQRIGRYLTCLRNVSERHLWSCGENYASRRMKELGYIINKSLEMTFFKYGLYECY